MTRNKLQKKKSVISACNVDYRLKRSGPKPDHILYQNQLPWLEYNSIYLLACTLGGQKYEPYAIPQDRGVKNAILHKNPEHFWFKN